MRFTKLRLNGFKSFVDPTDLVIAEGLTGVVGPNGCGKSNLLEALRWVMGENRPTAMRGGGMEDVIFAGTATRPARNFAEVALVIDNGERLAPAAFNDSDHLDITRRITRDAGSAYKVGTRDVRARDVQMLFADASTGAHSPALVRQGQISELINAKPTNRRRILEEAAGISGLYQRRHEAELKLKGAEQNLARVDDVVGQLAAQLGTLARQARQAARYREIGTALRHAEGLLLYRRWHDAAAALAEAEAEVRSRTLAAVQAERAAEQAAARRAAADDALPPLREEDAIAAAVVQRLTVQRDQLDEREAQAAAAIATLTRRIDQLTRDIARESSLNADAADTIARLTAEAEEIARAGDGHDDALAAAQDASTAAAEVLAQREQDLDQLTEDVARLSARHQSAQRLLDDSRKTVTRAEAEADRARSAMATAGAARDAADAAFAAATAAEEIATATAQNAEETLLDTEAARAATQGQESDARALRSAAEGEANALRAEVAGLSRLVDRDAGEGSQVLDLLRVDRGYEAALGAALSDDLKAPAVTADDVSGWVTLAAYDATQPLPAGVRPLSDVVDAPDVLARRIAQVGLVEAADGARLQGDLRPGQRLVSQAGDLWRWDGFRTAAADAPSAAALRLQQLNRLADLQADLDRAEAAAQDATATHETLTARLAALTEADRTARHARRDADARVAEAHRAASRAEAERNLADGRLESLELAVARHADEASSARAQLQQAEAAQAELPDLDAARASAGDIRMTVEAARMTMLTRRATADDLRRTGEARQKRGQEIAKDLNGWRNRLDTATQRSTELLARKAASEDDLAAAAAVPDELAAVREALAESIATAADRRAAAADALAVAETALRDATLAERDAERAASDAREARARSDARGDAARETAATASDRIAEDRDTTPQALLADLGITPEALPAVERIEVDIAGHRRQRDALGAVNLRAEEDAREVQTEHDELVGEKADLEAAIAALRSGIAGLNKEGRERLLTAFEQVNASFATLFRSLFGGGDARLELVESDDPLEAGLEIMCQPPGKKLSTLSLLSGGEQTLTAMALIFAVFLANPAPICVLDEVDAPLDDANVTRFCDLLDEMTRRTDTRFLIITHHAVTMSRMDRLFGVTMGEQGVSQLVSVDLKKAEAMVA
ncbi:condensin subunit Smc [Loktanella atrilutea]|uniref:Chromosome partition protein Smc n=1 Tax=Loktanella atrilutea TaxID=366533 RepID=A0A1M4WN52_LOKAT|nr:chromosome segregation protein SMC [Loktanella atrilutea]SHE82648.1 condensin subunit Smc [Loktanella atrilutea]